MTNHKPLFTKEMNNIKIQSWAILLAECNWSVEYNKRRLNIGADMLSRINQKPSINTFDTDY